MDPTRLMPAQLTKGRSKINTETFAGGMKQEMASLPQVRMAHRWYSTAQILTVAVPLGFVGALAMIAAAQELRTLPSIQEFIRMYPGVGDFSRPVESGFPWWCGGSII